MSFSLDTVSPWHAVGDATASWWTILWQSIPLMKYTYYTVVTFSSTGVSSNGDLVSQLIDFLSFKLLSHDWYQQSRRISVYLSMDDEVDTTPVVKVRGFSSYWYFRDTVAVSFVPMDRIFWSQEGDMIIVMGLWYLSPTTECLCRQCFIPRYVGDQMDMLQLYSLDDLAALPHTKWNIKQPAG